MVRAPLHLHSILLVAASASTCHAFRPNGPHRPLTFLATEAQRLKRTFLKYQSNATDVALSPWVAEWHIATPVNERILLEEEERLADFLLREAPLIHDNDQDEKSSTTSTTTALSASAATAEATTAQEQQQPMSDVCKARLLLLGASALYGTNFSLVKILGETGMSVGLSSTLRFGMAALATLPWLLAVDERDEDGQQRDNGNYLQRLFDPSGTEFRAALGGLEVGMWNSIGYVAQAVGLETTSASKSAFLCSLAVVMVPILDYLGGKKLLSREVMGALLAVVGVGFLEFEPGAAAGGGLEAGDIASLIQPVAFGLGFCRMEAAMAKYPEEADRATAAQLLAVFLGSAAYMVAMNTFSDPTTIPPTAQLVEWVTDPAILGALFWTGVVTTALTIYMETVALKTLSAAETTLIFSTEPLWGTAFASVVMGETLGLNAAAGAVLILFGCVFSNLGKDGMADMFIPGRSSSKEEVSGDDSATLYPTAFRTDSNQDVLPPTTTDPAAKFSLKSSLATSLAGIVATIENMAP